VSSIVSPTVLSTPRSRLALAQAAESLEEEVQQVEKALAAQVQTRAGQEARLEKLQGLASTLQADRVAFSRMAPRKVALERAAYVCVGWRGGACRARQVSSRAGQGRAGQCLLGMEMTNVRATRLCTPLSVAG